MSRPARVAVLFMMEHFRRISRDHPPSVAKMRSQFLEGGANGQRLIAIIKTVRNLIKQVSGVVVDCEVQPFHAIFSYNFYYPQNQRFTLLLEQDSFHVATRRHVTKRMPVNRFETSQAKPSEKTLLFGRNASLPRLDLRFRMGGHGNPPLLGRLNTVLDLNEPSLYARVDGRYAKIGISKRDKKPPVAAACRRAIRQDRRHRCAIRSRCAAAC